MSGYEPGGPVSGPAVVKIGHLVPVSKWFIEDLEVARSPWLRPDRNPIPRLVIWPRWDRTVAWIAEARHRIDTALDVLRNGTDTEGEEW